MGVGSRTIGSIRGVEEAVYHGTSPSSTRQGSRNASGSEHVGLCNGRNVVSKRGTWEVEASSLYLEVAEPSRKEL